MLIEYEHCSRAPWSEHVSLNEGSWMPTVRSVKREARRDAALSWVRKSCLWLVFSFLHCMVGCRYVFLPLRRRDVVGE